IAPLSLGSTGERSCCPDREDCPAAHTASPPITTTSTIATHSSTMPTRRREGGGFPDAAPPPVVGLASLLVSVAVTARPSRRARPRPPSPPVRARDGC